MVKKAFLSGFYGRGNMGDDVLLASAALGVNRSLGIDSFFFTGSSVPECAGEFKFVPVYKNWFKRLNVSRALKAAAQSYYIVFGGGSTFHSETMEVRSRWVDAAKGNVNFAVGVSLGPFKNTASEKACAALLKKLSFTGVRDQASLEIAKDIAPNARVEKTFDLAPLILQKMTDLPEVKSKGNFGSIGLALCEVHGRSGIEGKIREKVLKETAETIRNLNRDGLLRRIVLLEFNGDKENGDREILNQLHDLVASEVEVDYIPYRAGLKEIVRQMSGLDCLVSMRLHGSIFGFMCDIPVINLSYHPKCVGWAAEIGMPEDLIVAVDKLSADVLHQAIAEALSENKRPILSKAQAVERAMKNWSWIDDLH